MDEKAMETLRKRARKARADTMQRHVLVCTDSDCDKSGKRTKQIKKDVAGRRMREQVTVTKVDCLDICKKGPVVVVYPEGTWYAKVKKDAAERIVEEHLVGGEVVEDHAFLVNDLSPRDA